MTRTSTLHTTNAGHRAMILPSPRKVSAIEQLAAIRTLETLKVLTPAVARKARGRVTKGN
jgi:hypothetical protein